MIPSRDLWTSLSMLLYLSLTSWAIRMNEEHACPSARVEDIKASANTLKRNKVRPWMAWIEIRRAGRGSHHCSGSILNKEWILSAGHCFCLDYLHCTRDNMGLRKEIFDSKAFYKPLKIEPGTVVLPFIPVRIYFPSETFVPVEYYRGSYSVREIRVHENYVEGEMDFDIGVLRLWMSMDYDILSFFTTKPIQLPSPRRSQENDLVKEFDCHLYKDQNTNQTMENCYRISQRNDSLAQCNLCQAPNQNSITYISGWRDSGLFARKEFICKTDHVGPQRFQKCETECVTREPPPQPRACLDFKVQKVLISEDVDIVYLLRNDSIAPRSFYSVENPSFVKSLKTHTLAQHFITCLNPRHLNTSGGWCSSCPGTNVRGQECMELARKDGQTWGFCSNDCNKEEIRSRKELIISIMDEYTVESFARDPPQCSHDLCTLLHRRSPSYKSLDLNGTDWTTSHQHVERIILQQRDEKGGNVPPPTYCSLYGGSGIWKQMGDGSPILVGLTSKPLQTDCLGEILGHVRILPHVAWILNAIRSGECLG